MPLPKSRWRECLVEGFGLFRDGGPGEGVDGALAAGVAEGFLFGWVGHDFVDAVGEVAGEFFSIHRFEWAFGHLLDGDEVAGFAVDDDLRDAVARAGHSRCNTARFGHFVKKIRFTREQPRFAPFFSGTPYCNGDFLKAHPRTFSRAADSLKRFSGVR